MINFLWLALGLGALLVSLALVLLLLRMNRTLAILEDTLLTVDGALRETVPEVKGSLGNVNDITAGVNVALRSAGTGASRLGDELGDVAASSARGASAAFYGVRVAGRSLLRSYFATDQRQQVRQAAGTGRKRQGGNACGE